MRTRLRTLNTDGRTYTWRAEIRHVSGDREIRLRVWGTGKNGQALQVDLRPVDPTHPRADFIYPDADEVRAVISDGLEQGWHPDAVGGTVELPPRTLP